MRAESYQRAHDIASQINSYEGEKPLSARDAQKGWIFRFLALIALGTPSVDAAENAIEVIEDMEAIWKCMKEMLSVKSSESVEEWIFQKTELMPVELRPELCMGLSALGMYGLMVEVIENLCISFLEERNLLVLYYLAHGHSQLGNKAAAERAWKLLPWHDAENAAYTQMVDLGISVLVGTAKFEEAQNLINEGVTSGRYNEMALRQLNYRRALVSRKLKQNDAVRRTISEMAIPQTDPTYLDAQLLLAKSSSPANALVIYSHLLSPNLQHLLTDVNTLRNVKHFELRSRYELAVESENLKDLIKRCELFQKEFPSSEETNAILFTEACALTKLAWFEAYPRAPKLPSASSFVPFSKQPSSRRKSGSFGTTTSKSVTTENSNSAPSPEPVSAATSSALPSVAPSLNREGEGLGKRSLWQQAVDKFEVALLRFSRGVKLIACYKKLLTLHVYLFEDRARAHLVKVAQKYADKSRRIDPSLPKVACLYAEQLRLAGRLDEAEATLRSVEQTRTVQLELALCKGERNPESAIPDLTGLHATPVELMARFHAGRLLERVGRFHDATVEYSGALGMDPRHMPSLYRNARLLLSRLNSPHLAIAAFNVILEHYPADMEILESKIHALIALGRHVEALRDINRLETLDPSHPRTPTLRTIIQGLVTPTTITSFAIDSAQSLTNAASSVMGYIGWN